LPVERFPTPLRSPSARQFSGKDLSPFFEKLHNNYVTKIDSNNINLPPLYDTGKDAKHDDIQGDDTDEDSGEITSVGHDKHHNDSEEKKTADRDCAKQPEWAKYKLKTTKKKLLEFLFQTCSSAGRNDGVTVTQFAEALGMLDREDTVRSALRVISNDYNLIKFDGGSHKRTTKTWYFVNWPLDETNWPPTQSHTLASRTRKKKFALVSANNRKNAKDRNASS
jgi:hypothetical protein